MSGGFCCEARIAVACAALIAAPLALSGCSLQADWDGSKKRASEECVLAAQLFTATSDTSSSLPELVEGLEEEASEPPLTRIDLAVALRAYVPEELHEMLLIYALPEPVARGDESEERQAEIIEVLSARSSSENALRGWAQLACGPEIALPASAVVGDEDPRSAWSTLSQLQAFESEFDGVRTITVAGATEPDHAVALCEQVRVNDAEARIQVSDLDGFPLALAEAGAACDYHPILFEELEVEESVIEPVEMPDS